MGIIKELIRTGIDYFDARELSKKENPISQLNLTVENEIQEPQFDISAHLAVYTINVYCYAAMKSIARDVASTAFKLQRERLVDGEFVWEDVERTPLNKVFQKANPNETFQSLIEREVLSLLASGNGYIIYDKLDREMYYVKPDFVTIKTDMSGNLIGFRIENRGIEYDADLDQLIHFKLPNPSGEYFGIPPSIVVRDSIMTKLSLNGYIKSFFKSNALIGTTFTTDQMLSTEQKQATRFELNKMFSGDGNSFGTAVLDKGQKIDKLSHNMKDLVPSEINNMIREDIGAAYGVPPSKLGLFGDMTFSNADIMDKTYMRDTVRPIAKSIASDITIQLLDGIDEKYRLWWDEDSVKVLQEDKNAKIERNIKLKQSGIITTNEARKDIGYAPSDDESADELSRKQPDPVPPEETDEEESFDKWLPRYTAKRFDYETKDIEAERIRIKKQNEIKLTVVEKRFEKILREFWNGQLKRILDRIETLSVDGKINRLLLYGIIGKGAESDATDLYNLLQENEELAKLIRPELTTVVRRAGQVGMNQIGVVGTFNSSDPQVLIELEKTINQIVGINQTSFDKLIKLLQNDYVSGETINTISKNIRGLYKDFSKSRAMTIARTEMNAVVSGAKLVGGIQGGATHKEWFATLDGATRGGHIGADGQIVPIREKFDVGGEFLMYPGDPSGSAGNVINCRCSHVNLTIEDV